MMEFDDRYLALMSLYKQLRGNPDKQTAAEKALEAANKLLESGSVSDIARETARYM